MRWQLCIDASEILNTIQASSEEEALLSLFLAEEGMWQPPCLSTGQMLSQEWGVRP